MLLALCVKMKPEVRERLIQMLSNFESLSYEELDWIGWNEPEFIHLGGTKYYPGVWSEQLSEEETLVVVQLTKWYFLKRFGKTNSLGFIRDKNNGFRYVDELAHE